MLLGCPVMHPISAKTSRPIVTSPQDSPPASGVPYFDTGFIPPTVEELQEKFPHLEILSLVGHGGMGTYYRARHPKLDRFAALKLLPVDPASDAGLIERFKKEAKAMARLNHTNIIRVYEFIETETALYLLMEFVEGDILERLINARYFDQSEILAIITQVCAALNHAHENGVIHRDLRPGNTMLDQSGLVKVGDFGLARLMGEELFRRKMTEANLAMGTMDYVAPEQLVAEHPVDHRADIYSVGMMIYKLLTRTLPRGSFVAPSTLVPSLDPRIDDLVIRCLQRNPDNRFQQVTELWVEANSLLEPPSPAKKGPSFIFRKD
jgi:eukaryotic-like serine/threonine-protein kinase